MKAKYIIVSEVAGDTRIVHSFEVEGKDDDEIEDKANEQMEDFINSLALQTEQGRG